MLEEQAHSYVWVLEEFDRVSGDLSARHVRRDVPEKPGQQPAIVTGKDS
ncbi:hypothetical protein [Kribbella sp. NPDC051770]